MNLLYLSYRYLFRKPWRTLLQIVLLALGIALVDMLILAEKQAEEWFSNQTKQVDLVVGAKGSPLQLILCNLFHLDWPTGNIDLATADKIAGSPLVKKAWPLALGDSYKGWRMVGTTNSYLDLFPTATMAQGNMFEESFEAVLGATVAEELSLKVGDQFYSQHGLDTAGDHHEHEAYRVAGILSPQQSVLDQLILTDIPSVWHSHHLETEEAIDSIGALGVPLHEQATITSMLIKFSNPIGPIRFMPYINQQTMMQAASPSFEINRLLSLLGEGATILKGLAYVLIAMGIMSILIALFTALDEQQYDMAIMRILGASRHKLLTFILLEGSILVVGGLVIGLVIAHLSLLLASQMLAPGLSPAEWYAEEWHMIAGIGFICFWLTLLPAIKAYRLSLSDTLNE